MITFNQGKVIHGLFQNTHKKIGETSMDFEEARQHLHGCYVTVPTQFLDDRELSPNIDGIQSHVRFLLDGGLNDKNAVFLVGGAAGDFSTLTFEERIHVTKAVVEATEGKVPVAMGAQTTSTAELIRLSKVARNLGATYIQVSCPFYFNHSEQDFLEYVTAAADATDIAIIVYNTFWTSTGVSLEMVNNLINIPNVVGLKWSSPDIGWMTFEQVIQLFKSRFSIIDNRMEFVASHILGARGFEVHVCNYWPEWGANLIESLNQKDYVKVQNQLLKVVQPFMKLWKKIEEEYTGGDGYLDKLCMELVGLPSSRSRPPTRDIRNQYREETRQMLIKAEVPRVIRS